jgi:hypothetical protein
MGVVLPGRCDINAMVVVVWYLAIAKPEKLE